MFALFVCHLSTILHFSLYLFLLIFWSIIIYPQKCNSTLQFLIFLNFYWNHIFNDWLIGCCITNNIFHVCQLNVHFDCHIVIVSMPASSATVRGFEPRSGKIIDYVLLLCKVCSIKETSNTGWLTIKIMCPRGARGISTHCCFGVLAL